MGRAVSLTFTRTAVVVDGEAGARVVRAHAGAVVRVGTVAVGRARARRARQVRERAAAVGAAVHAAELLAVLLRGEVIRVAVAAAVRECLALAIRRVVVPAGDRRAAHAAGRVGQRARVGCVCLNKDSGQNHPDSGSSRTCSHRSSSSNWPSTSARCPVFHRRQCNCRCCPSTPCLADTGARLKPL